jgi:hypothetical protein
VPSDVPSMVPSLQPSFAPSDYPSFVRSQWTAQDFGLPKGFQVCGLTDSVDFDTLEDVGMNYIYQIQLEVGVDLGGATKRVEQIFQDTVVGSMCNDAATLPWYLGRIRAVATLPEDITTGMIDFQLLDTVRK